MQANRVMRDVDVSPVKAKPFTIRQTGFAGQAGALEFTAPGTLTKNLGRVAAVSTVHADMHPDIYKIALLSWALFMGVFWVTFAGSANALFMVAISTAYAIMFFGVPYVMTRLTPRKASPKRGLMLFLRGKVDTIYGPINGAEALVQVVMIPIALSMGGVVIGFIIHAARIAH